MSKPHIRVVAAEIERDGRYLITQRRPQATMPLLWEFPGGKVEADESDEQALARELRPAWGRGVRPRADPARLARVRPLHHRPRRLPRPDRRRGRAGPRPPLGAREFDQQFPGAFPPAIEQLLKGEAATSVAPPPPPPAPGSPKGEERPAPRPRRRRQPDRVVGRGGDAGAAGTAAPWRARPPGALDSAPPRTPAAGGPMVGLRHSTTAPVRSGARSARRRGAQQRPPPATGRRTSGEVSRGARAACPHRRHPGARNGDEAHVAPQLEVVVVRHGDGERHHARTRRGPVTEPGGCAVPCGADRVGPIPPAAARPSRPAAAAAPASPGAPTTCAVGPAGSRPAACVVDIKEPVHARAARRASPAWGLEWAPPQVPPAGPGRVGVSATPSSRDRGGRSARPRQPMPGAATGPMPAPRSRERSRGARRPPRPRREPSASGVGRGPAAASPRGGRPQPPGRTGQRPRPQRRAPRAGVTGQPDAGEDQLVVRQAADTRRSGIRERVGAGAVHRGPRFRSSSSRSRPARTQGPGAPAPARPDARPRDDRPPTRVCGVEVRPRAGSRRRRRAAAAAA